MKAYKFTKEDARNKLLGFGLSEEDADDAIELFLQHPFHIQLTKNFGLTEKQCIAFLNVFNHSPYVELRPHTNSRCKDFRTEEILRMTKEGRSGIEIARELGVTDRTVWRRRRELRQKGLLPKYEGISSTEYFKRRYGEGPEW